MTEEPSAAPLEQSQLAPAAGAPARRALAQHGYTRYEQLTTVTVDELLKIHAVGPKAIQVLARELAARGLSFRP
jgi:hypothetical protein